MNWLQNIAPTIAAALGGQLGSLAYEVVAKTMGISQGDAEKMLTSGKLTADQLAQVQQAEIALKTKAMELNIDFEKLAVQDRGSARLMQTSTQSWIPAFLSVGITLGFFLLLFVGNFKLVLTNKEVAKKAANLTRYASDFCASLFNFFVGSDYAFDRLKGKLATRKYGDGIDSCTLSNDCSSLQLGNGQTACVLKVRHLFKCHPITRPFKSSIFA